MAKKLNRWAAALIASFLSVPLLADDACYEGSADTGELRFSGVAEGSPFEGRFQDFAVTFCFDNGDPTTARIRVDVATGSATIGNSQGDRALKDEELFYVDRFPQAVWTSDEIVADAEGYRAEGELTLRGVEADQTVRLRLDQAADPLRLTGGANIRRLDYRVGIGEFEDTEFIDNRVELSFDLELEPR